jgi:hypothetical protein
MSLRELAMLSIEDIEMQKSNLTLATTHYEVKPRIMHASGACCGSPSRVRTNCKARCGLMQQPATCLLRFAGVAAARECPPTASSTARRCRPRPPWPPLIAEIVREGREQHRWPPVHVAVALLLAMDMSGGSKPLQPHLHLSVPSA